MEWKQISLSKKMMIPDTWQARYIITLAVREKIINWKVYCLAYEKINRVDNGSWMFEKPKNRQWLDNQVMVYQDWSI